MKTTNLHLTNTDLNLLNHVSDYTVLISQSGEVLWINQSFSDFVYNTDLSNILEVVHKNDHEHFSNFLKNNTETTLRLKYNSKIIWINLKKRNYTFNNSECILLIGKSDSLIYTNENYFKELSHEALFGYCEYSYDEKLIYLTPGMCNILGLDTKTKHIHLNDYIKMVHPIDNLMFVNWLEYSLNSNKLESIEYRIIDTNDKIKHIKSYVKNTESTGLNFKRRVVFIQDITQLKKSINHLKYSELQFKSIFTSAPIGIMYVSLSGEIIDINDAALRILGSPSKEETIKINMLNYPLLQKFGVSQKVNECIISKETQKFTSSYKSKWGKISELQFIITPLADNGQINGVLIIGEDISERSKIKNQLTESNARHLKTLQLIPDTILVFNTKNKVVDLHKPADGECKLFNDSIKGQDLKVAAPQDVYNLITVKTKWVIKNNKPSNFKFKVTINKEQLAFEARISKIDEDSFMVIFKEVTEHNITKQQLAEKEVRLEEASRIAKLGWYEVIGTEGYYYGSWQTHNIFFDEYIGNPIKKENLLNVIHPDDIEQFFNTVNSNIEKKSKDFSWEYRLITPNKRLKYVWTKTYLEFDEKGNLSGRFGVILDISELKRVQVALERSQKRLVEAKNKAEEADRLKSAFLANMSHEIRTPLNAILGFSSLLEYEDYTKEEYKDFIKTINNNGQYLLNIINDIIDFSKIEANQLSMNLAECSVHKLLDETFVLMQNLIPNRVKFRIAKQNKNDILIISDSKRLQQVLVNLISNSAKFTDEGHIEFGYKFNQNNKNIIFFVKDTGCGIANDKQKEIFNRFHQLNYIKQGAGLGLSISQGILGLLNGRIWVESKLNIGSTFYFEVPTNKKKGLDNENQTLIL